MKAAFKQLELIFGVRWLSAVINTGALARCMATIHGETVSTVSITTRLADHLSEVRC
jgi:hypothetical protein